MLEAKTSGRSSLDGDSLLYTHIETATVQGKSYTGNRPAVAEWLFREVEASDLPGNVKAAVSRFDYLKRRAGSRDTAITYEEGVEFTPKLMDEEQFVDRNCRAFHRSLKSGCPYVAPAVVVEDKEKLLDALEYVMNDLEQNAPDWDAVTDTYETLQSFRNSLVRTLGPRKGETQ